MLRKFTLEYWMDEGWYVGRLKEVPGVFSQGETLEELEKNVREAYRLMMEEEYPDLPVRKVETKEIGVEV
jgi:predicted RNase H-like HicB family nuclease